VAALVIPTFGNFYLVKNHKIDGNSATNEAREKIKNKDIFGIFRILENKIYACLTKFENYQILLNKISGRFLVATKLYSGWKSLIYNSTVEFFHQKLVF